MVNHGIIEIANSSRILQYKYQLEEKINEDILSYDKEMNEKISNSSNKIYTYTEYLKKIIRKEIENMGLINILNYNKIEVKEIKKQLRWLESEILKKINKNGYFDTIYKEFEFCINDRETNSSNQIYYEYIEKMLYHRFKNDFFEIKEEDISSRGFSYKFVFNKEKIVFRLELGKNLKKIIMKAINNKEVE